MSEKQGNRPLVALVPKPQLRNTSSVSAESPTKRYKLSPVIYLTAGRHGIKIQVLYTDRVPLVRSRSSMIRGVNILRYLFACFVVVLSTHISMANLAAAVLLTTTPDRVEIVAATHKVVFTKDAAGHFVPSTFIRNGTAWQPMFDAGIPILQGPNFDLLPMAYAIRENSEHQVAVLFSGIHDQPRYSWDLLVEAKQNSPLIRFRVTCHLPKMLILAGLAPHVMLWGTSPKEQVELSQGPGNIYFGHPEKQWGNSFPAAYLWADAKESAIFFNMTPMDWMSPKNLYRFHDCRVQSLSEGGKTGLGMRVVKRNFHEVPAGDMAFEFYLYASARPQKPTRLEALDTMVSVFAEIHPATAVWPTNQISGRPVAWSDFARGTIDNLMLKDICWADVPISTGKPWRDASPFSERTLSTLRVGPDYSIGSRCSSSSDPTSLKHLWDFSCCNNYLAPWIAYNHLHPDAKQQAFLDAKQRGLPTFYDPRTKLLRAFPLDADQPETGKEMVWQNLTFSLETVKIHRMTAWQEFDPAVPGKFLMNTRGLIQLAHNEDYIFPQWFDPRTKQAITQSDQPELGKIREPWQGGAYAYLMCLAYEMTGQQEYMTEAKTAVDRLFGGMKFGVKNQKYEIAYADPVDFPITEIFGNSWGVAAAYYLHQHTGDAKYLDRARDFRNVLLRMTYWYESQLQDDSLDRVLHNAGLFRNHGGAFTGSPWENAEAMLPLTIALKYSKATDKSMELLLRLFNLQRINGFYFYPAAVADQTIACPALRQSPANYLPIEDFYMLEHGGRHGAMGRAAYMSSLALWNYLLYEAFAEADRREVMSLNLDIIDSPQDALAGIERNFVIYNPTDTAQDFALRMKSLRPGNYRATVTDIKGHTDAQPYTASALTKGVPLKLNAKSHLRLRLMHAEATELQAQAALVRNAQKQLIQAYLRLIELAETGDPTIADRKAVFNAAMAAYRQGEFPTAAAKAEQTIRPHD